MKVIDCSNFTNDIFYKLFNYKYNNPDWKISLENEINPITFLKLKTLTDNLIHIGKKREDESLESYVDRFFLVNNLIDEWRYYCEWLDKLKKTPCSDCNKLETREGFYSIPLIEIRGKTYRFCLECYVSRLEKINDKLFTDMPFLKNHIKSVEMNKSFH